MFFAFCSHSSFAYIKKTPAAAFLQWLEFFLKYMIEAVHSMFLRKKNLKFFCCSFEKNVLLRMCIQQQMRMFSMSH